ncbi:MAG: hypothetical protein ACOX6T_22285 [Myxococcales bacterium]|jgi:hypothetical protein
MDLTKTKPVLAGLLALSVALPAQATVVEPMDVETLSRRADLVVQGTALSSESSFVNGQIQTVTRVRVDCALKGQAPAVVEVRTPGGRVGDLGQMVTGAPQFAPGEEVIVFLRRLPGGARFRVEGMSLGKFDVVKAPDGRRMVTRNDEGLSIKLPDGGVQQATRFEPVPEPVFLERVRSAVRQEQIQ